MPICCHTSNRVGRPGESARKSGSVVKQSATSRPTGHAMLLATGCGGTRGGRMGFPVRCFVDQR